MGGRKEEWSHDMNAQDRETIALIGLTAACVDGHLGPEERERTGHLLEELGYGDRELFREAMERAVDPESLGARLSDREAARAGYQMALVVCMADGALNEVEADFVQRLRVATGLSDAAAKGLRVEAEQYVDPGLPPAETGPAPGRGKEEIDQAILRYAMLAGAAELLPQALASVVVLPLQLKMVYETGQRHGVSLDRQQVTELAGTFGIGVTSQVMERFARRVLGGVARSVGGKALGGLMGGAAGAAAGVAASFATTWALGHAAEAYYAGGRRMSREDLRALFSRLQGDARTLYPRVESEIRDLAEGLDAQALLRQVRSLG